MEKISWTDHVRNEEVLLRVKEQRSILHEVRKRKSNWIGYILRRNFLLQEVIEGKINLLKPNDIYIYVSYRSANLLTPHFKNLFNKYTY